MKEQLYQYMVSQSGSLSAKEIAISFAAALIIGMVIFISYRFSHTGSVYSAKFNVSLVMMILVTTLVMNVIGNNLALSLGMVGALSIVRFRTAVKDSRDTTYIFWCIAAGICCGIQDYLVAGIGSGVIFLVMLLLGNVRNNDRYLLIVHGADCASEIFSVINQYYGGKATLRVENTDRGHVEQIYEVSASMNRRAIRKNDDMTIQTKLLEIKAVDSVNFVCQNDEITR